jgi:hypothetical protein
MFFMEQFQKSEEMKPMLLQVKEWLGSEEMEFLNAIVGEEKGHGILSWVESEKMSRTQD